MLHTVNKSPYEKNSLDTCLRLAKQGSAILLIEDGVYAATGGTSETDKMKRVTDTHSVCVLGPDLKARGLDEAQVIDGIEVVGYDGFVDLAVEHNTVQSWL
ncbi:MAG: sulfurtransferase complex subunit TusB [Gammaproteobacteria bacterium]|nr:sulfurtransferase complex subunit TusB [Gammaproteobacteria bacterium]